MAVLIRRPRRRKRSPRRLMVEPSSTVLCAVKSIQN
nr:MAG TPA: hypothetical protein [Caudoviricetes sp.]